MRKLQKGFTLVEMLVVVVLIGILAAIALPKFANTKSKATVASMKSDLRNLAVAEEAAFADSARYSTVVDTLPGDVNIIPSQGNVILINQGTDKMWHATVTNPAVAISCQLGSGSGAPDQSLNCSSN